MSLIWTESFSGFRKDGVATHDDLRAADYTVMSDNAEWMIIDDMVIPDRVVASLVPFDENGGSATLGRRLPAYAAPVMIGFSIYIPMSYERPELDSDPLLSFTLHEDMAEAGAEVFRLRRDLQVSYLGNSPQNEAVMVPGRVHYVEVGVALDDIRVWLDDVFVLQHTTMLQSPVGWMLALSAAGCGISNLYVLNEDSVYPNIRLGRATRVVGERPEADVSVDFERPVGASSNAEVAAQDYLETPVQVLQGTNVGDQDVYSVIESPIAAVDHVHAITVKVRAANADQKPRAVSPFVMSDDESDDGIEPVAYHYLAPFTSADILCSAFIPGFGVAVGTSSGQVWVSEDGERFDCPAGLMGVQVTDMVAKSNVLVAVCDDGRVIRGDFGTTPATWQIVTTPINTALRAVDANDTRIVAVGDGGRILISATGEAWSLVGSGTTLDLTAVTFAGGHWVAAGSFTDNSLRVSLDNGTAWITTTAAKPPVEGPLKMRTLAGRTIVMGAGATPIASRLALLGHDTPFYEATKLGNLSPVPPCSDVTYSDDVYLFAMADGTTLVSRDAISCQLSDALDMPIRTLVQVGDSRLLLAGDVGWAYLRAAMPAITELPVLGGYVNGFTAVSRDPATDLPWEPAAAAEANIGVRISDVPAYGDTGRYLLTEEGLRILTERRRKILLDDYTK